MLEHIVSKQSCMVSRFLTVSQGKSLVLSRSFLSFFLLRKTKVEFSDEIIYLYGPPAITHNLYGLLYSK